MRRKLTLPAALFATAFVGGCASDANPARDLAIMAGVTGGEPKPAPDFVSRTRRETPDFVPVGSNAPKRSYKAKTAQEVAKDEAELDRTRTATEARGAALRQQAASDAKGTGR